MTSFLIIFILSTIALYLFVTIVLPFLAFLLGAFVLGVAAILDAFDSHRKKR